MSIPHTQLNADTMHFLHVQHIQHCLSIIPQRFHATIMARYEAKYRVTQREANLYLLACKERAILAYRGGRL